MKILDLTKKNTFRAILEALMSMLIVDVSAPTPSSTMAS